MSYSYSQKSQNRFRDNNRKPFYYIRKGGYAAGWVKGPSCQ